MGNWRYKTRKVNDLYKNPELLKGIEIWDGTQWCTATEARRTLDTASGVTFVAPYERYDHTTVEYQFQVWQGDTIRTRRPAKHPEPKTWTPAELIEAIRDGAIITYRQPGCVAHKIHVATDPSHMVCTRVGHAHPDKLACVYGLKLNMRGEPSRVSGLARAGIPKTHILHAIYVIDVTPAELYTEKR